MDRLIEFFARNPVLLLVAIVWLFGMIGNVAKAAKQARERAAQRQASQPTSSPMRPAAPPRQVRPAPEPAGRPMGERDADAVAREMRRILGLDPASGDARAERGEASTGDRSGQTETPARPAPAPRPAPRPVVRAEQPRSRRDVAAPEKPPTPVQSSTNRRRLDIHVDPHVGESIGKRARVGSGKVGEHALGELGGRAHAAAIRPVRGSRYELDDLKRAFVLSEILGPPLASRPERRES